MLSRGIGIVYPFAAFVETIAIQRQSGGSQVAHQFRVLSGRGQEFGRLFQGRLLQLQPQFLKKRKEKNVEMEMMLRAETCLRLTWVHWRSARMAVSSSSVGECRSLCSMSIPARTTCDNPDRTRSQRRRMFSRCS